MDSQRFCGQCGKPLRADGQFCTHCGSFSGASGTTTSPGETVRLGPWERILDRLKAVTAGRYDVQRLLGWGGMAGVYLAEETRLKRRVAIKVIAPGLLMDPSQIERFEQEARTTAQLNHPNIVTIFEVDEREDLHYFTMTYVPGRSLSQVMAEASRPLPLQVVEAWIRQVAGALSYAHQRGIVHRDIKPGNILLDEHGNALVGDFGIAKVAEEPGLTRTGMLVGTPAYMSPEQCTTGQVTGASDQYSLGAVAYQLIAGEPPFAGSTIQVIQAHVNEAPRDVRTLRPDCPALLADVVMRMLAKAPQDRWPTLYDAVDAIGSATLRHDDPVRRVMTSLSAWTHGVRIDGPDRVDEGGEARFTAVTLDHTGAELPDRRVDWSVSPPGIAEIDGGGRVRALGPGHAHVVASSGRVRAEWVLEVGSPTPLPGGLGAAGAVREAAGDPSPTPGPPPAPSSGAPDPASAPAAEAPSPPPAPLDEPVDPTPAPSAALDPWPVAPDEEAEADEEDAAPPEDDEPREPAPPLRDPVFAGADAAPEGDDPFITRVVSESEAAGMVVAEQAEAPAKPGPPPPPRKLPVPLLAGVGVVAVVAAAAIFALGGGDEVPAPGDDPSAAAVTEAPPTDPAPSTVPAEDSLPTLAEGEDADSATVVASAPEDRPTPTATGPVDTPAGPTTAARDSAPRTPPPPTTGTVRILGDLPAGSLVRVRGNGVDRATGDRTLQLAPGRYTLEVRVDGYRPASTDVTVAAGANRDWRPSLVAEAVQSPTPPVETRDTAPSTPVTANPGPSDAEARAAAIEAAVQAFGAALQSRQGARLRQAWPGIPDADARRWDGLMGSSAVSELQVTVSVGPIPGGSADRVDVPLDLRLRFYSTQQGRQDNTNPWIATVERRGESWVLTGLRSGG